MRRPLRRRLPLPPMTKSFRFHIPRRKWHLAALLPLLVALLIALLWPKGCVRQLVQERRERRALAVDTVLAHSRKVDAHFARPRRPLQLYDAEGKRIRMKIKGVDNYQTAFPDLNDIQLATASRLGIPLVADRNEAQHHMHDLVYIGDNPYFRVERLSHSIPYLVPRAERLLTEIARNFIDSLQSKGLPFYKLVVTSVLRTREDVDRLRRVNGNASENSCHQYGTTFDICYNSFYRVYDPDDSTKRQVWSGNLKAVLAEVLADQRRLGTCYVRYESFQSCFHITAR